MGPSNQYISYRRANKQQHEAPDKSLSVFWTNILKCELRAQTAFLWYWIITIKALSVKKLRNPLPVFMIIHLSLSVAVFAAVFQLWNWLLTPPVLWWMVLFSLWRFEYVTVQPQCNSPSSSLVLMLFTSVVNGVLFCFRYVALFHLSPWCSGNWTH